MLRTYEYRLYPNNAQCTILMKHFGCARFVYNKALSLKIDTYKNEKKTLSKYDLTKQVTAWKHTEELSWLQEVNAQSLQQEMFYLESAFVRFFREKKGYPKYKTKRSHRYSYSIPQGVKINFEKNKIYIPKIGWINFKASRTFTGKVKTCTIKKVPSGKYFISVLFEDGFEQPNKLPIEENTTIGIDMGLETFATLSDGSKYERIRILKKEEKQLIKLQKRLSKKVPNSKNREKARIKVARQQERITNIRKDYLHKVSTNIINKNQVNTICLETLNIHGMMKNHKLAKALSDVGLYTFKQMIEYKALLKGKNILYIGQFEPSSQMCSTCGYKNTKLKNLSIREWECPVCGSYHDRDINAAINIKNMALNESNLKYQNTGLGESVELVELLALASTMKQEQNIF